MKIKSTFSILLSNFKVVYKLVLFILILALLFSLLFTACIVPIMNGLAKQFDEIGVEQAVSDYIDSYYTGVNIEEHYNTMIEKVSLIDDALGDWSINIVFSFIALFVIIFITAILYYMAFYTVSDIVKTFMSTNSGFGFASNYIANIRRSFSFSIRYTPISLFMFLVIVGMDVLIFLTIKNLLLALYLVVFVTLVILALRRALFLYWIPIMTVDGLSAKDAFVKNFEYLKGNFWRVFGAYVMIFIFSVMAIVLATIVTIGVALIISFAVAWFSMQIVDMVEFYHIRGFKYYIDEQTVINPNKKYRDAIADEDNFSL